jgi:amino acid permease
MWGEGGEQKPVPDLGVVDAEDTETTRGVLTALMNLTMLVAQVVVATTTGTLYISTRTLYNHASTGKELIRKICDHCIVLLST